MSEVDQATWRLPWLQLGDYLAREKREMQRTGKVKIKRKVPRTEKEITDALFDYCRMWTFTIPAKERIEYGQWLLERAPIATWTEQLGVEMWEVWSARYREKERQYDERTA